MPVIDTIIKKEALQKEPTFSDTANAKIDEFKTTVNTKVNEFKTEVSNTYNEAKGTINNYSSTGNKSSSSAPWLASGSSGKYVNPTCINDNGTYLWCFMTAYANNQKTALAAAYLDGSNKPTQGSAIASFQFLMEDKLDLTINHDWDTGTDIIANAAQKFVDAANQSKLVQLGSRAPQAIEKMIEDNQAIDQNNFISQVGDSFKNAAAASSTPRLSMDELKLFKSTGRQSVTFNFTLGVWKSSGGSYADKLYNEIVMPVKSLQWCSSAYKSSAFTIEYPAIFNVKVGTTRSSRYLLEMEYAFLTSVQPTFNAPWVEGMPMTCNLALTFENLLPIYKQTFQSGGFSGLSSF